MIHKIKYGINPGIPPGMRRIKNNRRNQNAFRPKKSPNPPHTPATIRLWRDLRKKWFELLISHPLLEIAEM